jgi:sporulation protein YlmC with PRC-barrel domain
MPLKRFTHLGAGWRVEPGVEDVRGFLVFDSAGKFLGIVDDLLVDMDNNEAINYVLIGQGNIAMMLSGKELIVPLDKLAIDQENRVVHLNVTLDQLWDFPTYRTLEDPDLRDEINAFWIFTASARRSAHDVTLSHPTSLESPPPIPPKVKPSKMPAGNPRIAAGLESPVPEGIVERALSRAAPETTEVVKKPAIKAIKPEAEEQKREKPAA